MPKRHAIGVLLVVLFCVAVIASAETGVERSGGLVGLVVWETAKWALALVSGIVLIWVKDAWDARREYQRRREALLSILLEPGEPPALSIVNAVLATEKALDKGQIPTVLLHAFNKDLWLDLVKSLAARNPANALQYWKLLGMIDLFNQSVDRVNSASSKLEFGPMDARDREVLRRLMRNFGRAGTSLHEAVIPVLEVLGAASSDVVACRRDVEEARSKLNAEAES